MMLYWFCCYVSFWYIA